MKASSPSLNGNPETDLNSINIPSSLVRLGYGKEIKNEKTYQLDLVKQARGNRGPSVDFRRQRIRA